jgi:hypothetical protein
MFVLPCALIEVVLGREIMTVRFTLGVCELRKKLVIKGLVKVEVISVDLSSLMCQYSWIIYKSITITYKMTLRAYKFRIAGN